VVLTRFFINLNFRIMEKEIKEGDVVKIKSGEIKMTVGYMTNNESVGCYYEKDGIIRNQEFPLCILTVVADK